MALEVPIKVRESNYKTRTGEDRTSRDIKFKDLGLEQYITIEKLYAEPQTFEGEKNGKKWKMNKTLVNYLGEKVNVNISEKALETWNPLPLGMVQVSKQEHESSMGTYNTYQFDVAEAPVNPLAESFPGSELVTDEEVPF
jgi:hypothetical protein